MFPVTRRLPHQTQRQPKFVLQLNHLDFGQRNGLADRVPYISNHNNSELVSLHSSFVFVLVILPFSPHQAKNGLNFVVGSSQSVF